MSIVEYLHLTTDDRMMVTLPFYYIFVQSLLLTHVAVGGSVVIENKLLFPENIVRGIQKMEATGFAGVPSTFTKMLKRSSIREATLEKLRYVTQAGGHLAPEIRKHVSEAFAPASLYIMYGATEAAPRMTYLEPSMLIEKLGSIGKAIPNVEVLVVDASGQPVPPYVTGEIIARGSNIMVGYWNDADATKEVIKNGYYHTGDLGQIDDEGYIYVVGRLNDMIKSNGYRVSAIEVEDAILEMEDVADVAVVPVADDITGEAIKAYLVLHQEQDLTLRTLRGRLKGRLPEYKMPQYIEIMNSLPRNKSGKIMKSEL
jgi:long-chain acyl-CoA synthetase